MIANSLYLFGAIRSLPWPGGSYRRKGRPLETLANAKNTRWLEMLVAERKRRSGKGSRRSKRPRGTTGASDGRESASGVVCFGAGGGGGGGGAGGGYARCMTARPGRGGGPVPARRSARRPDGPGDNAAGRQGRLRRARIGVAAEVQRSQATSATSTSDQQRLDRVFGPQRVRRSAFDKMFASNVRRLLPRSRFAPEWLREARQHRQRQAEWPAASGLSAAAYGATKASLEGDDARLARVQRRRGARPMRSPQTRYTPTPARSHTRRSEKTRRGAALTSEEIAEVVARRRIPRASYITAQPSPKTADAERSSTNGGLVSPRCGDVPGSRRLDRGSASSPWNTSVRRPNCVSSGTAGSRGVFAFLDPPRPWPRAGARRSGRWLPARTARLLRERS